MECRRKGRERERRKGKGREEGGKLGSEKKLWVGGQLGS